MLCSEDVTRKNGVHLFMQGDLCDKKAIEAIFDLHRYATKLVLALIFLFSLEIDVQLRMLEYPTSESLVGIYQVQSILAESML